MAWNWKWVAIGYGVGFLYGVLANFLHLPSAFDLIVMVGGSIGDRTPSCS
jgi:uncharacterized membrane protein AbrB (regulator of aidB expression)